jgi:hypothetical protein
MIDSFYRMRRKWEWEEQERKMGMKNRPEWE